MYKKFASFPHRPFFALLLLLTCCTFALTACSPASSDREETKTRFAKNAYNIYTDTAGVYFSSFEGFLYYFDYSSQKSALVCSKANCLHRETVSGMSEEMICDAYTSFAPVFTVGSKLYAVTPVEMNGYSLIVSDLDRTNQETLMETSNYLSNFYVYDNQFFYTLIERTVQEMDGYSATTDEQSAELHVIDLDTGEDKTLVILDSNYSSEIDIVLADEETLYLKYVFYDEQMTYENAESIDLRIEYYAVSFDSHEVTPAYETLWDSMYWFICKDEDITYLFYYYSLNTLNGIIYACDSDTGELEAIASEVIYQQLADNKIIYYSMDVSQLTDYNSNFGDLPKEGFYYDIDTLEESAFSYSFPYEIYGEYEDHFIIISTVNNTAEWLYMPKDEYFNGTYNSVSMRD